MRTTQDIYDSQVMIIQDRIMPWIEAQQGTAQDLEDFRRRVIEKFETEANLQVDVRAYWTDEQGTIAFDIDIQRNLLPWDPDMQVHEVVNNLADVPEDRGKGTIKTDKVMIEELGAENRGPLAGGGHAHG